MNPLRRPPLGLTPRALAALLLALAAAGCLGSTVPGTSAGDVQYETHVFDHAPPAGPAIEGGISVSEGDDGSERHRVALVASAEAAERFDRELLAAEGAAAFVDGTDFERSYLVVFQAFPASSRPDYRVERIELTDGVLDVHVDDSSGGGTTDVTVETLLVQVDRGGEPVPDEVTVTTEEGETFSTGSAARSD